MNISAINPLKSIQIRIFSLIPVVMLLILTELNAADTGAEQQWLEQIRNNIDIGQPQDLPLKDAAGADSTFFSIYTPHTTAKPKGAVILMHGLGAHPDWKDVIHPLRTELPDKGWASLSIQLPLSASAKQDESSQKQLIESTVPRIDAAIAFLRSQSYDYIALISHGYGSLISLNFLQAKADARTPDDKPLVNAAVIISTPSSGTSIPHNSPAMIEKLSIPLLDLYGSRDNANVMRSAKARKAAAYKAANKQFRQTETIGANHFYQGLDDELVSYIYYWLNKTLKSAQ